MSVARILINNASAFSHCGHFGKIALYQPGAIKLSDLPIQVIIKDAHSGEEFPSSLVAVIGFTDHIVPDVLSRIYESKPADQSTKEILARCKAKNINQLGFYLYEYTPG